MPKSRLVIQSNRTGEYHNKSPRIDVMTEGGVYVLRIHAMHLRRKVDDLTVQAEMLTGAMEFEKLHPTFDDRTLRVTGSRVVKRNMGISSPS